MPGPVFRVRYPTGAEIHAGERITDEHGNTVIFLRAVGATAPGVPGRIVVSDGYDGETGERREYEHSAAPYGLRCHRVVPHHSDASGKWCPFSLCGSLSGECPAHPSADAPEAE